MTRRDNLTRFLGALLMVTGISVFVIIGASISPIKRKPYILIPPALLILAGAFTANRAES